MKWNVDFYTFLNTWEGFQKKHSQVSTPHVEALGYHRSVPWGYFLMMHLETFDLFGAIKLVNALRPPQLMPEHRLFELGCFPAHRDNWKAKREWELMSLFGKYCKWVGVGQETKLRSSGECVGLLLHSLHKQEPAKLRCERAPCAPPNGTQRWPFTAASHSLLFSAKIQMWKRKMERKITIYTYIYYIQVL